MVREAVVSIACTRCGARAAAIAIVTLQGAVTGISVTELVCRILPQILSFTLKVQIQDTAHSKGVGINALTCAVTCTLPV